MRVQKTYFAHKKTDTVVTFTASAFKYFYLYLLNDLNQVATCIIKDG